MKLSINILIIVFIDQAICFTNLHDNEAANEAVMIIGGIRIEKKQDNYYKFYNSKEFCDFNHFPLRSVELYGCPDGEYIEVPYLENELFYASAVYNENLKTVMVCGGKKCSKYYRRIVEEKSCYFLNINQMKWQKMNNLINSRSEFLLAMTTINSDYKFKKVPLVIGENIFQSLEYFENKWKTYSNLNQNSFSENFFDKCLESISDNLSFDSVEYFDDEWIINLDKIEFSTFDDSYFAYKCKELIKYLNQNTDQQFVEYYDGQWTIDIDNIKDNIVNNEDSVKKCIIVDDNFIYQIGENRLYLYDLKFKKSYSIPYLDTKISSDAKYSCATYKDIDKKILVSNGQWVILDGKGSGIEITEPFYMDGAPSSEDKLFSFRNTIAIFGARNCENQKEDCISGNEVYFYKKKNLSLQNNTSNWKLQNIKLKEKRSYHAVANIPSDFCKHFKKV